MFFHSHSRMPRRVDTSPRKRPLQRRAQATVDAILDAAAHILVRDGYDALSTNRVAERAGVSIGSLYQYFPNKEALVGDLVDRYSGMLFALVTETFASMADAPPRALAGAMVRAMIETKRDKGPRLAKVLREQIPRTGRLSRYEIELARVIALAAAYLEHHRAVLRIDDAHTGAFVAVHMVDALTHAAITERAEAEDEAMIGTITDAVARYLLRDAEPERPHAAGRSQRRVRK
jgi:AcrR family transcriptional regulator